LFGGSAGREGAALQLGGSISSLLGRILRLDEKTKHILTMCGMGAFFSALFGTPLGAFIFALEVVSVGHFCSAALFPALLSSATAFGVATFFGVHPERFLINVDPALEMNVLWKVMVIAVAGAFVSFAFCHIMHFSEHFFTKYLKNEYLRITVGGVLIVGLTALIGNSDYNGGGIEVINRVFGGGNVRPEAFVLKILFTAITIGVGFKGGEIIPTLFIGATLGAWVGGLVGLDVGLSAAVGIASLFCGVTNCPLATVVLCIELFNGKGMIFCALACMTSFLLSGNSSLYTGQKLIYSKLNDEEINVNAG
jgi:H+/Cl- antiporter ClcA